MGASRTERAVRNVLTGFVSKLLLMIFAFSTKTIFVKLLGAEYNGVNGLFSNILSILSLSELGIGNVLNYSLYRALKDNDKEKVCSLVNYFRKIYFIIAFAVLGIGVALVPALSYIVNSELPQDKIVTYYLLYLLNSVVSYFVVYKTTVIVADQKNYISNITNTILTFIMYVLQIIYLLLRKDFLGYLIIQVLCTIGQNVILSFIADHRYPYLKDKVDGEKKVFDKKELFSNIQATFLYKIASVILNNTDNILISIIVGTVYVGYYSNYYMIVSYIVSFVSIFITGITASLGNLNAEDNSEASYQMFNIFSLIFSFIGAVTTCCLVNCIQDFIPYWIGAQYVQPITWVIVIVINNYLNEIMSPIWLFRETMGLFKQVQYLMLITAGLNLVFSIVLGLLWGVPGILIATVLSKLVSQYWYEPRLLFKRKFNRNPKLFFFNQIKQLCACLTAVVISMLICHFISSSLVGIVIKACLSVVCAVMCVWLFNCKSEAWKCILERYGKPILKKIKR